tara:strand:- start:164 stop:493 length:330 start_codon:yes stop_codon:yes gene_type:complete
MNKFNQYKVNSTLDTIQSESVSLRIELFKYAKSLLKLDNVLDTEQLIKFANDFINDNIKSKELARYDIHGNQNNFFTTYNGKRHLCCTLRKLCSIHKSKFKNSKVITIN